ncbi:hypothetical protein AQUSIP_22490 [Aquicella siphonis]|uniref:Phytanoyl-CoA dioxygenase n=1 Tax=Aquicella siphonis TaxID=254247 RepID=A0A5E4PKZ2_9COXI|nr:phytanoyl-CoA dioxygenase family protein [Aquicella siphonis]VVC76922.1 hypothetical protein AQUSIP_22490 [Aquicella siphonis]
MQTITASVPSQESAENAILTSAQQHAFAQDGFLILENFISDDICDLLIKRAQMLIDQFEPDAVKTIFSAKDQRHAKNQYFLESGDKIHFFFEEGAIDMHGQLIKEKSLSINKIGHALHDVDPVFNCFSRMHKIASLVRDAGVSHPLLLQSMYICKQPYIGGEVTCHQDSTYIFVKDQPVLGLWFALEDATLENGCLWAIPGGHHGGLKSRSIRDVNDKVSTTVFDNTPWPLEKMVPLEVPRGSVILLHGLSPHMSKENISSKSRHAYTLHVISGQHEYAKDNWLQRSRDFPLKGFV